MAEGEYRRLAAACHCGEPVKAWSGQGRKPLYCESHKGPPKEKPAKVKSEKQCPGCRGIFTSVTPWHVYCSKSCSVRTRRGSKPRDEMRTHVCAHCYGNFESAHFAPMYCSKRCKQRAHQAKTPRKPRPPKPKLLCAYFAGYCSRCGDPHGSLHNWTLCPACKRADALTASRAACAALALAKHKATARTTCCDECSTVFCPLYGASQASLCMVCADARARALKAAHKAKRRALQRGVDAESVNPFKVFERDGWRCQLCKVKTPRTKRGTYADDAPELDHIVPLAKGGAHTYANTQCACRRCNGLKADRVLGQALLFG